MLQKLDQLIQQKKKEIASLQNLLGSIGKQNPIEKKPEEKTGNPEQE